MGSAWLLIIIVAELILYICTPRNILFITFVSPERSPYKTLSPVIGSPKLTPGDRRVTIPDLRICCISRSLRFGSVVTLAVVVVVVDAIAVAVAVAVVFVVVAKSYHIYYHYGVRSQKPP